MINNSSMQSVMSELRWQVTNILKPLWDKFDLPAPDEIQLETILGQNRTVCRLLWNDLQKYIELDIDIYKYPTMMIVDEAFIYKVAALNGYFLETNQVKDCQMLLELTTPPIT